jgi:hypothetical protein
MGWLLDDGVAIEEEGEGLAGRTWQGGPGVHYTRECLLNATALVYVDNVPL